MHVLQNLAVGYMKEEGKKCVIFFLGIPIVACLPWLCSLFHKIHFFLYFETFIYLSLPRTYSMIYNHNNDIYVRVHINRKILGSFYGPVFFRIHCYCDAIIAFFVVLYSHNPTRPVAIILIEKFWYYIIIIISGYKVLHNGKLMEL